MNPFVLATANPHKAREVCEVMSAAVGEPLRIAELLAGDRPFAFVVARPRDVTEAVRELPHLAQPPDVAETASTLAANARIKAEGVGGALGIATVADDTGLEVDALDGAPGVWAARYAGEHASYADNVEKLLSELEGVEPVRRTARFVTVALAWWPDGREIVARGEVEGVIAPKPRGRGGFGYDPVFVPTEANGSTFAEMDAETKHVISHRGRAFRALAARIAATT